ncbi:hypothetical protein HOLDEFILI_01512 [Holdemania filiformis DSM 12042]|uniref:Uncharacterized protein n=1 Tax=Holdemania filiformis DSM 12042 TaxID=545696 RepID=B9Y6R9_9FIRM|nr:hypothetical protein HOLDEFILI_01512 [Holdemania filiformis DSM 12042]
MDDGFHDRGFPRSFLQIEICLKLRHNGQTAYRQIPIVPI